MSREESYSQTISTLLQTQSNRRSPDPSPTTTATTATTAASAIFTKWTPQSIHHRQLPAKGTSQRLLKYILLTVPTLHATRPLLPEHAPSKDLASSHVISERRRRERINERFVLLRSMLPIVTKMDKVTILGDAIDYVKRLRRRVQELEDHTRRVEGERARGGSTEVVGSVVAEKRKVRLVEGSGGGGALMVGVEDPPLSVEMLQVSIIESEGLIEMECPYKEGLLVDVMRSLREMRVEVTGVQSCFNHGFFKAELRAKVREKVNGKKASIVEVKRAITQLVPPKHAR